MAAPSRDQIPLLLLKTKSSPTDAYEDYFSTFESGQYEPVFVPVLEHHFQQEILDQLQRDVRDGAFLSTSDQKKSSRFGALIFTSQRAVEAFTSVVKDIRAVDGAEALDRLLPPNLPLYVVGPATARGLRALNLQCPILGEETGNGDALATFILDHYNCLYTGPDKPPILFLVGDKRRDIIPKTLQSQELPQEKMAQVVEWVVYETGEMQSFKSEFSKLWRQNVGLNKVRQWIVVFSPTGCRAMLESLGLLDEDTGKLRSEASQRNVLVATIGPTTRDFLVNEFGFLPDVCAEKPSPEGIAAGIKKFSEESSSHC